MECPRLIPLSTNRVCPSLDDKLIHHILRFVGIEKRNYITKERTYPNFDIIENADTRERFPIYLKDEYLPGLFKDGGSNDLGELGLAFQILIPYNPRYYHSPGTAGDVGAFGILDVFLWYIEVPHMRSPDNQQPPPIAPHHPYAPAALFGAVTCGHVALLEQLACLDRGTFDFYGILQSDMNEEQLDRHTWHLPYESTAHTVFTFLLYGAFDANSVAAARWLTIWLLHCTPYDEVADVYDGILYLWHETKFRELLGTKEPISKFYTLTDFRTKAQKAFPTQD